MLQMKCTLVFHRLCGGVCLDPAIGKFDQSQSRPLGLFSFTDESLQIAQRFLIDV